jgi:hypothetical protein
MRKIKFLLFSVLLAGAAFTSCSPDELIDVPDVDKPVVTVYNVNASGAKTEAITAPINTYEVGAVVPVIVRFDMGAQSDKLTRVKITTTIGTQSFTVLDSTLNDGWFNGSDKFHEEKYNIAVGQSISTIEFRTWDKKNREGVKTITVGPKDLVSVKTQRVVLLAGQLNITSPNGGFYSVMTDKTYKLDDAVINAQYVDFVYYYGEENHATISPLSDPIFYRKNATTGKYNGPANYDSIIRKFAVLNKTTFLPATAADYNGGVMPKGEFKAEGQTNLKVGDYRAFTTILGQKGIFKVVFVEENQENDGSKRYITLDVKIVK